MPESPARRAAGATLPADDRPDPGDPLDYRAIAEAASSAQRVAETRLRDTEARYRTLVERIPAVVYVQPNHALPLAYVSPQIETLLGFTPAEAMAGLDFWPSRVHPDDLDAWRAEANRTMETGDAFRAEYRLLARDGRVVWIRDEAFLVAAPGQPPAWQGVITDVTEQRAAATRFQTVVEQVPAIVYVEAVTATGGETAGTLRYVSPRVTSVLGYTPEDWLTEGAWNDHLHPADRARVEAEDARCDATGDPFRAEYRLRHRDGHWVWIRDESRLVANGHGDRAWQGVMLDITDLKRADAERLALAEAQAARVEADAARLRLHDLIQGLDAVVWEAEVDPFRLTFVSRHAEALLGFPVDEWLAAPDFWDRRLHPDDRAAAQAAWRGALAARARLDHEYRVVAVDGRVLWLRDMVVFPPEGGARGLLVDVTDRKRVEHDIAHERDLLQVLMDHVPDLIYFKDAESRFTRVNRAHADFLGIADPADAVGRSDPDFFSPDLAGAYLADEQRLIASGDPIVDQEQRHGDGPTERWFLATKVPIRDASGAVTAIVGTSKDVTDRHRAADALRAAKEEAERANRAKSEFLSRTSHELRTPLNAVLGFAQLLEMDDLAADQRRSVDQILTAGRHLLGLIDEVLDIARVESGRLHLSPEPVEAVTLIEEVAHLIAPLAAAGDLTVQIAVAAARDRWLFADRQRLRQILLNLLSNAVKYTPPGGMVAVACRPVGSGVRISVRDTGPGIPPDRRDRLFQPFDRLGAEQTTIQGTGLGLALSQRIAEEMGTRIELADAAGGGSAFTFWLPAEATAPGANDPAQTSTDRAATVLYLEDSLADLALVERVVARRPGVRLLPAMDAELGLALARAHRPDLILLDRTLPDLDTEAILRRLRDDARTAHLPVVVVAADASPAAVARLRAAGARSVLAKPVDVRHLLAVLDGVVGGAISP